MDANLYVAESIETMENQKLLAVGLYADRVIIVNVPPGVPHPTVAAPAAMPRLTLAMNIRGIRVGTRSVEMSLRSPDGNEMVGNKTAVTMDVPIDGSVNLIVKAEPFLIGQKGLYTVRATVEGATVDQTFEIKYRDVPAPRHA